jgi:hypothetical protein
MFCGGPAWVIHLRAQSVCHAPRKTALNQRRSAQLPCNQPVTPDRNRGFGHYFKCALRDD